MPNRAGLDRLDDLICHAKYRATGKASRDGAAAVDAGEGFILGITAQLQSLFNHRGKVLICSDVRHFGVRHHRRGEHPVGIACFGRHQTVGGEQHRCGKFRKLLLLVLPRRAEIALEMGILFQFRIAVSGEHFAMGVDVDAFALSLLQQQLQVVEVMAGDDDERSLFHGQRNGNRHGRSVAFGVGLIQKRHALEVFLANLHHDRQQFLHAPVLANGEERLGKEAVHLVIGIPQDHGVMCISCHAAHAKQNEGFQASDILIGAPEQVHIVVAGASARGSAACAVGCQPRLFTMYPADQFPNRFFVEIHIGDRGKKSLDHQPPHLWRCLHTAVRGSGQSNQSASQLILKLCDIGGLAAYSRFSGTAGTGRCLLALKTKHFTFHLEFLSICLIQNFTIDGDGDHLPRNELSAGLKRLFRRHLQAAAAGHLHAEDGHALDVVIANNLGQLFAVIHSIQLRAADESHLAAHKLLMEIGVGIGRAVRCDQ